MSIENPTTFLDLVQRTRLECGITGSGPTSVTGNTGLEQLLVGWVNDAWMHVQRLHPDWHFMRKSTSFATVEGQSIYTPTEAGVPAGTFGFWIDEAARSYETSAGVSSEIFLTYIRDYDAWRNAYLFGGTRDTRTQPLAFAVHEPDHGLALGPVPSAGYTVTMDYFEKPVALTADSDVPSIPTQYILIILYKAMMAYGQYDSAPEVLQRGAQNYAEILSALEHDRLNETIFSGALA